MKIIFFGNTKYSLIGAKIIHEKIGLTAIVTLPDRPDKRGKLTPSPLKTFALEKYIPVITANKLTDDTIQQIASLKPDFFVVEDYGLILPERLLSLPTKASLNIHHSLLPKYRGPSPAPAAILAGEKTTGVTIIHMAKRVDAGDIIEQATYDMQPNETTDSLLIVLNAMGGNLIVPILKKYNLEQATPQDETQATFTTMLKKTDGYIDITNPPTPTHTDRMIRAYYPWPGVWGEIIIKNQKVRIKFLPQQMIQLEGKKPISLKDFINGYPESKEIIEGVLIR